MTIAGLLIWLTGTWGCQKQSGKLQIEFNTNVATYSIVEHVVAKHRGRLFYIDGQANLEYLPMAKTASVQMRLFNNSQIIQQTIKYLDVVGNQQDITYQALVRHNTFPEKGYKHNLKALNLDSATEQALADYMEALRVFFVERQLDKFFADNSRFIEGALREVKKNIPNRYIEKMENYYRESHHAYRFIVNPFDVVPYDTVFWHGNGVRIVSNEHKEAIMISSPYVPLEHRASVADYQTFGFDHARTIRTIITHEFGHAFVNPVFEQHEAEILKSATLMSDAFVGAMDPQGYGYWPTCVIEHVVRLCEIRIAESDGDLATANHLRKFHIDDCSFVLIPELESRIKEFERTRDASFASFAPQLLQVIDSNTVKDVRGKLGLKTETFTVTINVSVPSGTSGVYITGNQSSVGNWNPGKIKLKKVSDTRYAITLTAFPDLKFKFTRGDWASEGVVEGVDEGADISIALSGDMNLPFTIKKWRD